MAERQMAPIRDVLGKFRADVEAARQRRGLITLTYMTLAASGEELPTVTYIPDVHFSPVELALSPVPSVTGELDMRHFTSRNDFSMWFVHMCYRFQQHCRIPAYPEPGTAIVSGPDGRLYTLAHPVFGSEDSIRISSIMPIHNGFTVVAHIHGHPINRLGNESWYPSIQDIEMFCGSEALFEIVIDSNGVTILARKLNFFKNLADFTKTEKDASGWFLFASARRMVGRVEERFYERWGMVKEDVADSTSGRLLLCQAVCEGIGCEMTRFELGENGWWKEVSTFYSPPTLTPLEREIAEYWCSEFSPDPEPAVSIPEYFRKKWLLRQLPLWNPKSE